MEEGWHKKSLEVKTSLLCDDGGVSMSVTVVDEIVVMPAQAATVGFDGLTKVKGICGWCPGGAL